MCWSLQIRRSFSPPSVGADHEPPRYRNGPAPIAEDGVKQIGELYRIEMEVRGLDPEARRAARQDRSKPVIADMET